jgi:hypothetical protein
MATVDVGQDGDGVGKVHVAALTRRVGTIDQGANQLTAVGVQGFPGLGGRVGGTFCSSKRFLGIGEGCEPVVRSTSEGGVRQRMLRVLR